jgi:uncharacterized membrane protein
MAAFSLFLFLLMFILFPLFFGELMVASLAKLHLSENTALMLFLAILFGGLINIPVARLSRDTPATVHPLAVYGFPQFMPQLRRTTQETIIAVNLGGCLIPVGLALYEALMLGAQGPNVLLGTAFACAVNAFVCFRIARPVAGIGIAMPGFVSPLVAVVSALLLAPDNAAPVAFIVGVTGPLVGADLFHLKDIKSAGTGLASIGGAGTFDGIVLSGIVAAYLA